MSDFKKQFLRTRSEKMSPTGQLDPRKMGPVGEREFEEAMLAHFDELNDIPKYLAQLKRMREQGMEPQGDGRPLPGTPYYDYGR